MSQKFFTSPCDSKALDIQFVEKDRYVNMQTFMISGIEQYPFPKKAEHKCYKWNDAVIS